MHHTCLTIVLLLLAVITAVMTTGTTTTDHVDTTTTDHVDTTGADHTDEEDSLNAEMHTLETELVMQSCICNCNCPQKVVCEQNEDSIKPSRPRDCKDLMLIGGNHEDGVYTVYLGDQNTPYQVYCDMTTDGGGWLVFQSRFNGETNFTRNYNEYAMGFGNIGGEFWLGNTALYLLTQQKKYKFRADMTDFNNVSAYAIYETFRVASSTDKYRLTIAGYSGTAVDSMAHQNDQKFSAEDADNDRSAAHCAQKYKSGWWYNKCYDTIPNGVYHNSVQHSCWTCMMWLHFHYDTSLKTIELKLRPQP